MVKLNSLEIDGNRVSIPIEKLPDFIKLLELDQRITELELNSANGVNQATPSERKTIGLVKASEMLGLSKSRVYVLSGQKKLPSYKVGNKVLFFVDELEQYIRSGGKFNAKTNVGGNGI
jgi:excisionase family DNA binding protein